MLSLTVIQGPDKGKRFELPEDEPQLIGRSSEALPITDETVSRRHAELTPDQGSWYLADLKSQNGTYVNGKSLRERTKLFEGDLIRVGSSLLLFGKGQPKEAEQVRVIKPEDMDVEVEHALPIDGNGAIPIIGGDPFAPEEPVRDGSADPSADSVILAEPEPSAAAVDHLRIIYQLTTITTQSMERDRLLRSVMDLIFAEFKPERGCMMLRDPRDNSDAPLKAAAVRYAKPPLDKDAAKIHVSRTILKHALEKSEGVLSTNAMMDPRFASGDSVQSFHIRSAICSPVRFRNRVYGAIYIDSSMANYTFTKEQLALMNAIGQHAGLALANIDLLQEKLHSERLAAVGETVASLSHSIKNILQGLRGGADVVEMGLTKQDLKVSLGGWEILKRNLNRIIALTLNMLAYSRQRTVEPELTRLDSLIDDCVQLVEKAANEKDVAVIVDADPEMPPIPLDPNLMHQAIMNLLTNALDAVPKGGAITVRTTFEVTDPLLGQTPAFAHLEVIDNGPGIPAEKQRWVFEPFATTKGLKGTGLGLAVTKRIVEDHRGRIELVSNSDDIAGGATFRIVLPADSGENLDPGATAEASPGGTGSLPGL